MYKELDKQTTFFGNMIYERIIPKDHFLRRLSSVIDLSFVNEITKEHYSHNTGRPCWEPQIIFKMLLLQYLYDLSDDKIEQECLYRLDFKWFLGIDVDQSPPDSTTLVRFRDRLGEKSFAEIFNRIVILAKKKKIVSDKLHIVDASHIRAKVDTWRIKKLNKDEQNYIDKHSPDKDARIGHISSKETIYGYKNYLRMDKESEIIISEEVSPANLPEANHLQVLLDGSPPKAVCGDKAFDTPQNQEFLRRRKIRSLILQKQPKVKKKLYGCFYNPKKQPIRIIEKIHKIRNSIEHKIAELKRWHRMRVCRFWGLVKTKIQHTMGCIAVNIKRIVNLLFEDLAPPGKKLLKYAT